MKEVRWRLGDVPGDMTPRELAGMRRHAAQWILFDLFGQVFAPAARLTPAEWLN